MNKEEEHAEHNTSPWLDAATIAAYNKLIASSIVKVSDFTKINADLSAMLARAATIGDWSKIFAQAFSPTAQDITKDIRTPGSLSKELKSPSSPFGSYSQRVESWDELLRVVEMISAKHGHLGLVWRGQENADWGLHSSLYRKLLKEHGLETLSPSLRGKPLNLPGEDDMVAAERKILQLSRHKWRQDGTSALQLFATLQHFGAPTRLIDITKNPMVAVWFAVTNALTSMNANNDGRVFVLATVPEGEEEADAYLNSRLELDDHWSKSVPPWIDLDDLTRKQAKWGTGDLRRVWFPPAFVERISAQNAGFVIDGIPIWTKETASTFKKTDKTPYTYWGRNDILYSGSIYARYYKYARKVQISRKRQWAPTFTFVIPAELK